MVILQFYSIFVEFNKGFFYHLPLVVSYNDHDAYSVWFGYG